ncbi:MAG: Hsp70 family protein [Pseudomonadota bacterium]
MYLGIDFGTTNTALAIADDAGDVTAAHFPNAGQRTSSFRSVLCFIEHDEHGRRSVETSAGPRAITDYLDYGSEARLIQSIKTFLSSAAFQETSVFGTRHTIEELIAILLRHLKAASHETLGALPSQVIAGRPVRFAGERADDDLAVRRLYAAFKMAGFVDISLAYEPLAAAYFYASTLDRPETCLIADFGGGTSDFSVVRFQPGPDGLTTSPLGHAGVGVAGDTFDYRIVQHIVCPLLGKHSYYRSFGKRLEVPKVYYTQFERWHHLSMLRTPRVLRDIREIMRTSENPEALLGLVHIIEEELGFHLYQAVNSTKVALSKSDDANFEFLFPPVEIACRISRSDFETWIHDDLQTIERSMLLALKNAGVEEKQISQVFMTGGTSLVPAVRRLFERRFGRDRLIHGDEFSSIAAGLALLHRAKAHPKLDGLDLVN